MNPYRQRQIVEAAKADIGWAYDELPWLSAEAAEPAERLRRELLDKLSGALSYSFNGTKPHLGPLSPGCRLCGTPGSIFHFINRACTRQCYFCPQDRSRNRDLPPLTDGMWFEEDGNFVRYVKAFEITGIGFSGGEPLMSPGRLISRMKAVRLDRGKDMHLWMYTNGDLLDHDVLRRLQSAGLNEIRFNISARDYDMTPIRLARSHIPTVTVEIPTIPEDIALVKKAMLEMETFGVDHLNLIQLEVSEDNYRSLNLSQYHVSHRIELLPVLESELCSLELMLFRQESRLRLPVHYCGFPYRFEVTNAQRAKRYNRQGLKEWEDVTEAGFIRTLVLTGSGGEIEQAIQHFGNATESAKQWWCNAEKTELWFHRDLLPCIQSMDSGVKILYHNQVPEAYTESGLKCRRDRVAEFMLSHAALVCWHRLYLEGWGTKEAFRSLAQEYPMTTAHASLKLADEIRLLKQIGAWEALGIRYPEILRLDPLGV